MQPQEKSSGIGWRPVCSGDISPYARGVGLHGGPVASRFVEKIAAQKYSSIVGEIVPHLDTPALVVNVRGHIDRSAHRRRREDVTIGLEDGGGTKPVPSVTATGK